MENRHARWVLGYDGSPGADRALDWCRAHAPGRAATVRIVRAWHYPTYAGAQFLPVAELDLQPDAVRPDIDALTDEFGSVGVELTSSVVYGIASKTLLDASADADLLVLGMRGLGGFGRLLLGSVSHQCATHATVPVVVVPGGGDAPPQHDRVVVGIDGSVGSIAALEWAQAFVPPASTVVAMGSWETSSWGGTLDAHDESVDWKRAKAAFDLLLDDLVQNDAAGRPVPERHFACGAPADSLLEAADTADLVVVGERGRHGLKAALLGSTATEVLHRAKRPTVIVPGPHGTTTGVN